MSASPGGHGHRGRGARATSRVALQYLDAWLGGNGAAAINNLMEDAATAEISRSQLWQWRTPGATLDDGGRSTARSIERSATRSSPSWAPAPMATWRRRPSCSMRSCSDDAFPEFLTLRAYPLLG